MRPVVTALLVKVCVVDTAYAPTMLDLTKISKDGRPHQCNIEPSDEISYIYYIQMSWKEIHYNLTNYIRHVIVPVMLKIHSKEQSDAVKSNQLTSA